MNAYAIVVMFALQAPAAPAVPGAPSLTLEASTKAAEKGHQFDLLVLVRAQAIVDSLQLAISVPLAFSAVAESIPGFSAVRVRPDGTVLVTHLEAGSSLTLRYRVRTPSQFLALRWLCFWCVSEPERGLDTPRDPKVFTVNATYLERRGRATIRRYVPSRIEVPYTVSSAIFLLAGIVGVWVGFVVKTLGKMEEDTRTKLTGTDSILVRIKVIVKHLYIEKLPRMITSLLLGFGGLVVFIRTDIPAGSYLNALAIGIGLGVLADDALIARLTSV